MQCTQQGHQNQLIEFVCTYSQCKFHKFVCTLCLQSSHSNHIQYYQQKYSLQGRLNKINDKMKQLDNLGQQLNSENYILLREELENYLNQNELLQLDILIQQPIKQQDPIIEQDQGDLNFVRQSSVFKPVFRPKKLVQQKEIKEQSVSEIYKLSNERVKQRSVIKLKKSEKIKEIECFNEGLQYFNQQKFDEAIKSFVEAIKLKIDFEEAWIHKILSETELKDYNFALKSCAEAKTYCQNSLDLYFINGLIFEEQKKFAEAFSQFEFVIKRSPNNFQNLFHAGFTSFHLKHHKEAESYLRQVLNVNSSHKHSQLLLGQIYLECGNIKKAQQYFQSVNEGQGIFHNAQCLKLLKQFDLAFKENERFCNQNPNDERGLIQKGEILIYQKKVNEAMMIFEQVTKFNPALNEEINNFLEIAFNNSKS